MSMASPDLKSNGIVFYIYSLGVATAKAFSPDVFDLAVD